MSSPSTNSATPSDTNPPGQELSSAHSARSVPQSRRGRGRGRHRHDVYPLRRWVWICSPWVGIILLGFVSAKPPSIAAYYRTKSFVMLLKGMRDLYGSARPWVMFVYRYVHDCACSLFDGYGSVLRKTIFRTYVWAAKMLPRTRVSGILGYSGSWGLAWIFMLVGASCLLQLSWSRFMVLYVPIAFYKALVQPTQQSVVTWWNVTQQSVIIRCCAMQQSVRTKSQAVRQQILAQWNAIRPSPRMTSTYASKLKAAKWKFVLWPLAVIALLVMYGILWLYANWTFEDWDEKVFRRLNGRADLL